MSVTKEQLERLGDESILDELEIHLKWFPQTTKGGIDPGRVGQSE